LVEQLGPDCAGDFSKGDRVFSLAYGGAYAEKICVSEKMLMHMPPDLSFEEAAGTPETYYTALQAVDQLGEMRPGKTALIHAGASGVGLSAIQVAKTLGALKVFATAGTDEKCRMCESVGATVGINYRTTDFASVVEKETDERGVDLIVDMVGRDYWSRNVQVAAIDARIAIVALLSGGKFEIDLRQLMGKRIWITTTTLRTREPDYQIDLRNTFVKKIMPAFKDGSAKTIVDKVYDWKDVSEAHKRMEANLNAGKIICTIS
jgi:NADPH:quinone reductase-like Zn-dependent oxidoreductase